jgi:hypothetical protein
MEIVNGISNDRKAVLVHDAYEGSFREPEKLHSARYFFPELLFEDELPAAGLLNPLYQKTRLPTHNRTIYCHDLLSIPTQWDLKIQKQIPRLLVQQIYL